MSRRNRDGNVIVSALLLLTLVGFTALVVDVGYGRTVRYQLEAAADAAAHAAVPYLDGTSAGITSARASATTIAAANRANGAPVVLASTDIVTGVWSNGTFTASNTPAAVNAVQVTARVPSLDTFFGSIAFDVDSLSVRSAAVAVRPPPAPPGGAECFLPITLPICALEKYPTGTLASIDFQFSTGATDNAAWGSLVDHPSASDISNYLSNCEAQGEAVMGDTVYVNNGVVASGLQEVGRQIEASTTEWDTSKLGPQPKRMTGSAVSASKYGRTLEGPILVFDQGAQDCSSVNYTQSYPLVGFAWGVVYDVKATGSPKDVRVRINNTVTKDFGTIGGGEVDAGVIYQPAPMVVR
jgi:Flp pilus assembly protein TadG